MSDGGTRAHAASGSAGTSDPPCASGQIGRVLPLFQITRVPFTAACIRNVKPRKMQSAWSSLVRQRPPASSPTSAVSKSSWCPPADWPVKSMAEETPGDASGEEALKSTSKLEQDASLPSFPNCDFQSGGVGLPSACPAVNAFSSWWWCSKRAANDGKEAAFYADYGELHEHADCWLLSVAPSGFQEHL